MAIGKVYVPQRMCIVTRERCDRTQMWRFVCRFTTSGAQLVFDPTASLPGRGAWIVQDREIYAQALQRRAFHRALRVSGLLNTDSATQALSAWCSDNVVLGTVTHSNLL